VKVVDALAGAEYWQRATAARAAVSRNLNMSNVEMSADGGNGSGEEREEAHGRARGLYTQARAGIRRERQVNGTAGVGREPRQGYVGTTNKRSRYYT
jgi:hypothetical protein